MPLLPDFATSATVSPDDVPKQTVLNINSVPRTYKEVTALLGQNMPKLLAPNVQEIYDTASPAFKRTYFFSWCNVGNVKVVSDGPIHPMNSEEFAHMFYSYFFEDSTFAQNSYEDYKNSKDWQAFEDRGINGRAYVEPNCDSHTCITLYSNLPIDYIHREVSALDHDLTHIPSSKPRTKRYLINKWLYHLAVENRRILPSRAAAINPYAYKPTPIFHSLENEETRPIYIGAEIEVDRLSTRHHPNEATVKSLALDQNLFYVKKDGSLRNGFEIVSHPISWEKWRTLDLKFMSTLYKMKFRPHQSKRCGLHFHLDKSMFGPWGVDALKELFVSDKITTLNIIRRQERQLVYCTLDCSGRKHYKAINETPTTWEFRVFNGTLSTTRMLTDMAMVISWTYSARDHIVTWPKYLDWLKGWKTHKSGLNEALSKKYINRLILRTTKALERGGSCA